MVAEGGRLADDDARPVVDEEALADLGTWMDVDPGAGVRIFGEDPRDERHAEFPKLMGDPIRAGGLQARVAEHDLFDVRRGWIAFIRRDDVRVEDPPDRGDAPQELDHDVFGKLLGLSANAADLGFVAHDTLNLLDQDLARGVEM